MNRVGSEERSFFVISYDIANDKRRLKIARLCEAMARRVQESVFEAYLNQTELEKLLKKIGRIMKEKEDNLRVYKLCSLCQQKVKVHGQGAVTPPPGVTIV